MYTSIEFLYQFAIYFLVQIVIWICVCVKEIQKATGTKIDKWYVYLFSQLKYALKKYSLKKCWSGINMVPFLCFGANNDH